MRIPLWTLTNGERAYRAEIANRPRVVRLMLSSGDTIYVRDKKRDARIGLRKGKCDCGKKTIRTDDDSKALDKLGPCKSEK